MAFSCMLKQSRFYRSCTNRELIEFLVAKTGNKRSPGKKKSYYVKLLREADDAATFRFLDLPPELRNIIYEELLTLNDAHRCFPDILSTCKQVHDEADAVLYGGNEFLLHVEARRLLEPEGKLCRVSFMNNRIVLGRRFEKYSRLLDAPKQWPDQMAKVRSLSLSISHDSGRCAYAVNHFLYRFMSYMARKGELKRLQVCLYKSGAPTSATRVLDVRELALRRLWPLGICSGSMQVKIVNSKGETLVHIPAAGHDCSEPAYDAISRYETLEMKLRSVEVKENLRLDPTSSALMSKATRAVQKWSLYSGYMTELSHREFTNDMMELEELTKSEQAGTPQATTADAIAKP